MLFLVAIVFTARLLWKEGEKPPKPVIVTSAAQDEAAAQDIKLLDQARPLSNQTLAGFLSAGTPEERNQFVVNPIATAARMARFYSLNPLVNIEPQTLSLDDNAVTVRERDTMAQERIPLEGLRSYLAERLVGA